MVSETKRREVTIEWTVHVSSPAFAAANVCACNDEAARARTGRHLNVDGQLTRLCSDEERRSARVREIDEPYADWQQLDLAGGL